MAKNTNNNQIFVERETFEKNGRTFFSYFIKGNIRGKDVKVAVVPTNEELVIATDTFDIVEKLR